MCFFSVRGIFFLSLFGILWSCSNKNASDNSLNNAIEANKKAFSELLESNKSNPAVNELSSGLQYEIIDTGKGTIPNRENKVKVHYTGTFLDGEVFDSSEQRGTPAIFPINHVIKGWQEVLVTMPTDSKWKVYMSSDWAYGDRGSGKIPGGAGLIFIIQLLGIE